MVPAHGLPVTGTIGKMATRDRIGTETGPAMGMTGSMMVGDPLVIWSSVGTGNREKMTARGLLAVWNSAGTGSSVETENSAGTGSSEATTARGRRVMRTAVESGINGKITARGTTTDNGRHRKKTGPVTGSNGKITGSAPLGNGIRDQMTDKDLFVTGNGGKMRGKECPMSGSVVIF